ncbi:bestrophin family ion channel [Robbsia sp. Bb-Pol-6]|uniref:Bestrophin family ion channel n=1 Tax=Robbsia betulipollinis TaxID=2981849 RepID=A0ABT3ZPN0_9BURK|nr:bestrophin family ion channel [Robbsia betulipollinis]MCY0388516.1 bestrophin family ion channel [Robbsia betulipollinis]
MMVQHGSRFNSLVRYLGWPLLALLFWDVAVTASYVMLHRGGSLELPSLPVSLFGSVLVLFLGVRTNAAYARWWEARTLWGAIVNASRSFARETLYLVSDAAPAQAVQRSMVRRQVAYAQALRLHLLRQDVTPALRVLSAGETGDARYDAFSNVPNALLNRHAADMAHCHAAGWLDRYDRIRLETTLVDLSNAQGGLERIKNTPLPKQYGQYLRFFVTAFCILLPIGLVDSLLYYTPLASTAVGFILMTIDKMGTDLQDPFTNSVHDVPMDSICRTIQIDLMESIGETAPTPAHSVDGVLW